MYCYLSALSHPALRQYMAEQGYRVVLLRPAADFEWENAAHPDSLLFPLEDRLFAFPKEGDGRNYPGSAMLNGLIAGNYFIHNLHCTCPSLLEAVRNKGFIPVNVRQGYTRCGLLKITENSLITADRGLYRVLKEKTDLELLLCQPGGILLDRHTGFWGGCAGRVGERVVFHGRLTGQPDEKKIRAFIAERGLGVVEFPFPLRDIGGWVFADDLLGEDSRVRWYLTRQTMTFAVL